MKSFVKFITIIFLASFAFACTPETTGGGSESDQVLKVSGVSLPSSVSTATGEEVIFKVYGQGPQATDKLVFVTDAGTEVKVNISTCTAKEFGFIVPEGMYTDTYTLYVERDTQRLKLGRLAITIELNITSSLKENTTVYGLVLCNGKPVKNVVISDGYEVTKTNADGMYELASAKKHNYVFMSIPSGYTVKLNGSQPLFYQYLVNSPSVKERADFTLFEDPGQDKHTMVVMGDIHLAARNNDASQFQSFVIYEFKFFDKVLWPYTRRPCMGSVLDS